METPRKAPCLLVGPNGSGWIVRILPPEGGEVRWRTFFTRTEAIMGAIGQAHALFLETGRRYPIWSDE